MQYLDIILEISIMHGGTYKVCTKNQAKIMASMPNLLEVLYMCDSPLEVNPRMLVSKLLKKFLSFSRKNSTLPCS
jgi:hypothetical protein